MAIAVRQIATANAGTASTISPTLSSAAVKDNVLVAIHAQANARNDSSVGDVSYDLPITDGNALAGSSNLGWIVVAKIAAGGETSWTSPADSSQGNHTGALIEIEGFTGTATLDDSAEDVSNRATVVTSQGTGTATASAAGFALAIFLNDAHTNSDGGRAYSDSFSEELSAPGNTRPGIFVASKTVSAGSVSCTFSTTDTGDEMVGCVLVLVDDAGGGGGITLTQSASETLALAEQGGTLALSMPLAQAAPEALVLAEQQGTLSLSIPLAQGSPEALTLTENGGILALSMPLVQSAPEALVITENGGTLTVGSDIALAQSAPETLVLAEQGGVLGLSMPLAQAAPETLTITEHGGLLSLGTPINLTQSAPEALVIAEQGGTLSLSIPLVQAAPEALAITEHGGTVHLSGGVDVRDGRHHGGGIPISDERHPYWRNRIEVEDEPAPAPEPTSVPRKPRRTRPDHAEQAAPTGDHLARAPTPGAEVAKALLDVPLPATEKAQARTSGAPPAVALSAPPARPDAASDALSREQRLIEELLLLELID